MIDISHIKKSWNRNPWRMNMKTDANNSAIKHERMTAIMNIFKKDLKK